MKSALAGATSTSSRPAGEFDVAHGRLGALVPQIAARGAARRPPESSSRSTNLLRRRGHHDLHLGAALDQAAHQVGALVGGDAAR